MWLGHEPRLPELTGSRPHVTLSVYRKGRGRWRLVDLACPDKNIVRRALLTVFRGWDSHSSTPARPPWQWLALFFSFPGPLCRWPACWRCQRKSGCSLRHNRSLASAHVGPLLFPIKSILGNICMAVLYPSVMALDYQRRACQHPCADECRCDTGDANLVFLLSCSARRGPTFDVS